MGKQKPYIMNIVISELKSTDGKPLDFSFKNAKNINDFKYIEPRQGKRKPIQLLQEENQIEVKDAKDQSIQQEEKDNIQQKEEEEEEKVDEQQVENVQELKESEFLKKGPQEFKLKPQNNINQLIAQHNIPLNSQVASKPGNTNNKNYEEMQIIQQKKMVKVNLICSTIILSYNQLRSLESSNFYNTVNSIMFNCKNLAWIDLSHNYLQDLNYDFGDFPNLKSLYLHVNFIADFNVLLKLNTPNLTQITLHGNPIETVPNYRFLVLSILPNLKKLDTVLVSKKELDNTNYLVLNQKNFKFPEIKNPQEPPKIQVPQDQKNKN